jgi:hypothetical protein
MIGSWHNNRISQKLNLEFAHDFSLCDIDGLVRCHYTLNDSKYTRFIIYESKNLYEIDIKSSQKMSLNILNDSINWSKFDNYSGVFILKIIDLDNEIQWYDLKDNLIRTTSFIDLYNIFSCKIY